MKYKEWYAKYVTGTTAPDKKPAPPKAVETAGVSLQDDGVGQAYTIAESGTPPDKRSTDRHIDKQQINLEEIRDNFIDKLKNTETTSATSAHVKRMQDYAAHTKYEIRDNQPTPFAYYLNSDIIGFNSGAPNFDKYDLNYVMAHELSHRMDALEYKSWANKNFIKAIYTCREHVYANAARIHEWFIDGGKYETDFAMSDIISALSRNQIEVPIGHLDEYLNIEKNLAAEIFAEISVIVAMEYKSNIEFLGLLRELYIAFKEMVK